jgi:hypothetical protein
VPDLQGGSGWLISEERWDRMCANKGVARNKYFDNADFTVALAAHPELTLEDYNQAPSYSLLKLKHAALRITTAPEADTVVDATITSAPFMCLTKVHHLEPIFNVSSVEKHVVGALAALRDAGGAPTPVQVRLRISCTVTHPYTFHCRRCPGALGL